MSGSSVNILLIEDNLAEARLLQEFLKEARHRQFNLVHAIRLQEGLQRIDRECFDIILLDLTLPDSQGLASLAPLMKQAPSVPIVVLTHTNDDELAIEAVRRGAQDYLVKRLVNSQVLVRSLHHAIERKQAQEMLREENEALENEIEQRTAELLKAREINQFKSEFVSMLSHDFRNPMNAILLSTGLLQKSENHLTREKKLAHYQIIRSAIKNMDRLLDEVILIGKAESGKLQYRPILLNLELFCRQIVEEIKQSTEGNKVTLIFISQGKSSEGWWDTILLGHILTNLLANAIKYSPAGGTVRFELIALEENVLIKIKDQGIGIPKEDVDRLFEPFYRASNVGSIPGTGLGLAIVKKCTEAQLGQISVESEVGWGTTFIVSLPYK